MLRQLSTLDRLPPLWIGAAMLGGLALGRLVPGLDQALDPLRLGDVSLPIALGLLLVMYPVLAKAGTASWAPSRATAGSCCPPWR